MRGQGCRHLYTKSYTHVSTLLGGGAVCSPYSPHTHREWGDGGQGHDVYMCFIIPQYSLVRFTREGWVDRDMGVSTHTHTLGNRDVSSHTYISHK